MLIPGVNVATFSGQYSTHKYTLLLMVHTAAIQKLQLSLANCDSCDPAGPVWVVVMQDLTGFLGMHW